MRRISLFFLLMFLASYTSNGTSPQPFYDLFGQCRNFYNPAFTAADGKLSSYMIGYYNYHGNYGGPAGVSIGPAYAYTADMAAEVLRYKRHGIRTGINYTRQDSKSTISNTLRLNVAYACHLSKRGQMTAGLNIDEIQNLTNFHYPWSPTFTRLSANTWNMGCGLAYTSSGNNFYLGTSMTYLRNVKLSDGNSTYYAYHPYFVMQSGIDIRQGKNFIFRPEIILNYRIICALNSSLTVEYKKRFSVGVIYNALTDNPGFRLGYKTRHIELNYAFSSYWSPYEKVNTGTHTLGIQYKLNK